MNPKHSEIVEVSDFERLRSEAEAALEVAPTRIVLESPLLDATNSAEIFEAIRKSIIDDPAGLWVLDLKQVRFLDSAAMTALVHLMSEPRLAGRLKLEGAGVGLRRRWPGIFASDLSGSETGERKGGI